MNIFSEMCRQLPIYKDLTACLENKWLPCAVTGVSNIHKAQLVGELSSLKSVLVVCDDEASATRLTADINEMAGDEIACLYPARDFNFAYMEGISREYEHKRIEAL